MIDNLKKKPAHVRDQVAVFVALAFAGIVTFFWVADMTHTYAAPETKTSFSQSLSPFKLFGASVRSALDRSKAELSTIDPSNPSGPSGGADTEVTVDQQGVVQLGSQYI